MNYRALITGAIGALVVVLLVGSIIATYIIWERALHGQQALECLNSPQCVDSMLQNYQRFMQRAAGQTKPVDKQPQ